MVASFEEGATQLSTADLREIFHSTNDAIFVHDGETGEILDVNETMCEMYGYTREEARTLSIEELSSGEPPYTREEAMTYLRQAVAGEPQVFEWHARDSEGGCFWVEVSMRRAVVDDELRVLVIARDIEDRKRRQQELEEQRELYATLVEQSPSGVVIVQDKVFQFANSEMAELTGYSVDELEGMPFYDLMSPEYRDLVQRRYEQRLRGENPPDSYDIEVVDADGQRHHIDLQVSRIQYQGEPAILGTFHDISRRKETEQKLRRQNERLEEFASVVSHDLRNPLSVAKARTELMENEHAPAVERSLERMESIIDDVLTLARHGQSVDETAPVSLGGLVERCWNHVDTSEATLSVDSDLPFRCDRGRTSQLLENLIRNSVEHAGPDVTITVGQLDDGDGFYVEDDGPGIPDSERKSVFEHGYTTTQDGTGFGLNIVAEIAEAHGWSVSVTDGSDGGARFEFTGVDSSESS
jgi:PAS domain S-box-containing protein